VCASSWYEIVANNISLEQGDIIEDCKILIPSEDGFFALLDSPDSETIQSMEYVEGNFIIMSQSCDLGNDKIDSVIVCPIISLRKIAEISPELGLNGSKQREQLRQGNIPSYHLLDELQLLTNPVLDFYCVSFKHIYSIPKEYLVKVIGISDRIRLLSPYKEHLSQSFARYFMRVGLPTDIQKSRLKGYQF